MLKVLDRYKRRELSVCAWIFCCSVCMSTYIYLAVYTLKTSVDCRKLSRARSGRTPRNSALQPLRTPTTRGTSSLRPHTLVAEGLIH